MGTPAKRKCLTLATKLEIIKTIDEGKLSKSEIGRQYKLSSSSLFTILKNRDKIQSTVLEGRKSAQHKRVRNAGHEDLETVLFKWVCETKEAGIPVTGPMIQNKADELALKLNISNFKCSNGWLYRFKQRRGITTYKVSGDSGTVDQKTIDEWKSVLQIIIKNYKQCNVYNADEHNLNYNFPPESSLQEFNEKDEKLNKKYLKILLCTNMDGSDKRKPFIIGKFALPQDIENSQFSYRYEENSQACMTSDLFKQWLKEFDVEIGSENRKIVLFIDQCSAHPIIHLQNIELIFFPKNSSSLLQPLEQGIFHFFKLEFRRRLVNKFIKCLARSNGKATKWDLVDAINTIVLCWNSITAQHIAVCFNRAGFIVNTNKNESEKEIPFNDDPYEESEIITADQYESNENVESDNLKQNTEKFLEENLSFEEEQSNFEENNENLSNNHEQQLTFPKQEDVLEALNVLHRVFWASNTVDHEIVQKFHAVGNWILSQIKKNK